LYSTGFVDGAQLGTFKIPEIKNEPFKHYPVGSPERAELRKAVDRLYNECPEIPCIIGGKEVRTGDIQTQVMPTEHGHAVCRFHQANEQVLKDAAAAAMDAKAMWESMPLADRIAIYLKAGDLLATKYRAELCAAVMLGTGKNVWQAEIDAAVETIDFWRFNARYAMEVYQQQPPCNDFGVWNRSEYRPLEGFVLAVSPFNFIAIGANLHSSPAVMGNTTVWKPASTAILGSWTIYKILKEAGLPDGVVNFVPSKGSQLGKTLIPHPDLAGLHFTGSTSTFNGIWRTISNNLESYRGYPRIVGETGGKNFHFVHESANPQQVLFQTVRSAFEYQGQKCSACSRMYVPSNLWPQIKEGLQQWSKEVKVGCVRDFDTYVAAVIDKASFSKITKYIDEAKKSKDCEVVIGGSYDGSKGYFIQPTVIETRDPKYVTMQEELFGPVLTVYVYDPKDWKETLRLCDSTSPYALTGSIFAQSRQAVVEASHALRHSAGNFYINDKSTGAIVGQQPFGGARQSGTNDKSGSLLNLPLDQRALHQGELPARGGIQIPPHGLSRLRAPNEPENY